MRKYATLKDLKIKGNKLSLKNPLKQHVDFTPDQVENKNDALCVVNMIYYMHREMCPPDQVRFFVRPYRKTKMKYDGYTFKIKTPVGGNIISNYVKEVAEFIGFENWERCTGHAPRKRCHDAMAEARIDTGEQCRMSGHKTLTVHKI